MQNDEVSEEAVRRVEVWNANNENYHKGFFAHRRASIYFPNKPARHFGNYRSMEQWFYDNVKNKDK